LRFDRTIRDDYDMTMPLLLEDLEQLGRAMNSEEFKKSHDHLLRIRKVCEANRAQRGTVDGCI
jgi:hypothetical protein